MAEQSLSWFQSELSALKADQSCVVEPHKIAYLESLLSRLTSDQYSTNNVLLKAACQALEQFQSENDEACNNNEDSQVSNKPDVQNANEPFRLTDLLTSIDTSSSETKTISSPSQSLEATLSEQEQSAIAKGNSDKAEVHCLDIQDSKHRVELNSMKVFREQIKYMDVDQLIRRALEECPPNPGPHNPQMLALKALTELRALSEQYTRRFALYIETMLWLEKNTNKLTGDKVNL